MSNHRNFSEHPPIVFIYFYNVKNKFKSNHQDNLENKEGRNPNYIVLFESSVFLGSGFCNPNYLEIKKDLISKFLAPLIQNISIGMFQSS